MIEDPVAGRVKAPSRRGLVVAGIAALTLALSWGLLLGFSKSAISSIESRSMSHADHDLDGVFDPGEWRRVEDVDRREGVVTLYEGRRTDHRMGADHGDVIGFVPVHRGEPARDLIVSHRVIAWVVYNETADAYDVPELGIEGQRRFTLPGIGTYDRRLEAYRHVDLGVQLDPDEAGRHDGFLTKGDHNRIFDQHAGGGLADVGTVELVEVARIEGRVTGHVDSDEILALQIGVPVFAAVIAAGAYLWRSRRAGRSSGKPRSGRCTSCGARRTDGLGFCPSCGAEQG